VSSNHHAWIERSLATAVADKKGWIIGHRLSRAANIIGYEGDGTMQRDELYA
jgi:hypothetical protein